MLGAVPIATAGATVSLTGFWETETTAPATVCEAVTVTAPSGKPRTSSAGVDQVPPLQGTDTDREPTTTVTLLPLAAQVPETV